MSAKKISIMIIAAIALFGMIGCHSAETKIIVPENDLVSESTTNLTVENTASEISEEETSNVANGASDVSEDTSSEESSNDVSLPDWTNRLKPKKDKEECSETPSEEISDDNEKSERKTDHKITLKNKNINDSVIEYKDITSETNIFKKGSTRYWEFSNFGKTAIAGCGLDDDITERMNKYKNDTENVIYSEGYYGIKAQIVNNRYLEIKPYSHLNDIKCEKLTIVYEEPNAVSPMVTKSGSTYRADLYDKEFANGMYVIHAEFPITYQNQMCNLYLFVDCYSNDESDYHFYLCEGRQLSLYADGDIRTTTLKNNLQKQIKEAGYTPENSLNPRITYPYENKDDRYYDTPFWRNKAHQIIEGYEYESNAFKALLLHDWMTENLVYDSYLSTKKFKARYYNDYASGKNYVSKTNTGVCRDFSNIYAIMCREVNIPCLLCSSNKEMHMWNLIYLDGEWKMIDLSEDVERNNTTEEIKHPTANAENTHCFCYFLIYDNDGCKIDVFNRNLRYY